MSCQACSSELREQDPFTYSCCGSPICSNCLARNPRLTDYSPCLRCGEVRTAEGSARVARGARERFERQVRKEDVFVLEDEDDEEVARGGDVASRSGDVEGRAPPPAYEDVVTQGDDQDRRQAPRLDEQVEVSENDLKEVEVKHTLSRGDTLLSIARKYATDPHHLLTLNNLPHTALSSNPTILRTRKHLVISRRLVPRSSLQTFSPSANLPDPFSTNGLEEDDPVRKRERELKRFQLLTKTPDKGVAGAYLAVAEAEVEGPSIRKSESGLGPKAFDMGETRGWDGFGSGEGMGGKKRLVGKEGRAVEKWFEDEDWEREVGQPEIRKEGKWKVVGSGSGMGIGVGVGMKE